MHDATEALGIAAWAAAHGEATAEELELLRADPRAWRRALERLRNQTADDLEDVHDIEGPEREQVIADFQRSLSLVEGALLLVSRAPDVAAAALVQADPLGEVRLQASWSAGSVVVWAAGPGTAPADNDELSDRLETIGGPALGWTLHPPVLLPTGARAAALAIPVTEALGWLVAVGGGLGGDGIGASVTWLGRVAVAGVRLVAAGAVVPTLHVAKRTE